MERQETVRAAFISCNKESRIWFNVFFMSINMIQNDSKFTSFNGEIQCWLQSYLTGCYKQNIFQEFIPSNEEPQIRLHWIPIECMWNEIFENQWDCIRHYYPNMQWILWVFIRQLIFVNSRDQMAWVIFYFELLRNQNFDQYWAILEDVMNVLISVYFRILIGSYNRWVFVSVIKL